MSASKPNRDFFKTTLTTAFGAVAMAMGEKAGDAVLASGIAYDQLRAFVKETLDAPLPPDGGYFASPYYRGF